ncbi:hypothetical protein [Psychrobacter sanguinis]|uniref:hypothetical protein n=1 Tax=Psychrobacter sanguinis TaxID=861445 RepID=UPI0019195A6E|nr:hypothetical protein [Psychrobacter sanguinis]MCC3344501.1 hypothetical protein [Psychrobacter sanguinis]
MTVTAMQLQLLEQKVPMPDLTIGQAMDIAKIPERFNEKRLSALIALVTGDSELADHLTVQERYYFLLNQQALSQNKYAVDCDMSEYFLDTDESAVLQEYLDEKTKIGVQHIRGSHVCLLETICENLFDWTCGLMACQLFGDLSSIVGGGISWDKLDAGMKQSDMNREVLARAEFISNLSEFDFNNLAEMFDNYVFMLSHYVDTSIDNKGITVIKEVAGEYVPARFQALYELRGHARQLARYIVE